MTQPVLHVRYASGPGSVAIFQGSQVVHMQLHRMPVGIDFPVREANVAQAIWNIAVVHLRRGANLTPLLASNTRQKYSPSSSPRRAVFQGPAASVNSRLTSQVAVCMCKLCAIFRVSHSVGVKSAQSNVGTKFTCSCRYKKLAQPPEIKIRLSWHCCAMGPGLQLCQDQ